MIYQGKTDPFDPNGGSGWRPQAYCGPTSMQMVLAFYGIKKPRDYIALTRLDKNGNVIETNYRSSSFRGQVYAKGTGSAYAPMVNMAKHLGFKNSKIHYVSHSRSSGTSLKSLLATGRPQIVSVKGRVRYTDGGSWNTRGHIMVATGMTGKGDVIVNDPARSGGQRIIPKRDFLRIWQGFSVDFKK